MTPNPSPLPGNVSAKLNHTLTPSGVPDPNQHTFAHVDPPQAAHLGSRLAHALT